MHELVLRVGQGLAEPVSDALVDELGALSVSVEDADAGTRDERPVFGEPGLGAPSATWAHATLRALFEDERDAERAAAWLLANPRWQPLHLLALSVLKDEDWVRLTQSQFAPVPIAPGFWIVPSWHEPPDDAATVIRLDPGLAFGTGTHPTTRMCLRWLASRGASCSAVLDYGCGSGILAIAAAKFGAARVDAVDIDAEAVEAARANAARNGVAIEVGPPDRASGSYAAVVANILATPLKLLAPLLSGYVRPGGDLVLAGILERQADELRGAYAPWIPLGVADREDGWILMTGSRPREEAR